ncbi:MAG TPA: hypothetical protein VHX39_21390, partial [Acetobacteraceae bacterium]|nr:hypothetical protein [Acetobacteraceae bacterium]
PPTTSTSNNSAAESPVISTSGTQSSGMTIPETPFWGVSHVWATWSIRLWHIPTLAAPDL